MADFEMTAGATSRRIPVWLADSSSTTGGGLTGLVFNAAGLTCYYWREDEGNVGGTAVTLATATRGTYASGGFVEKDATNLPGLYEFGVPNAALAAGAKWVKVMFKGATNLAPREVTIRLTAFDADTALTSQTVGTATAVTTVNGLANGIITAAKFGVGAIDAPALATDAATEIADTLLDRDLSVGTDSGSPTVRTVRQALRFLRNKWAVVTGTLTVYKEDDTTASWTSAVATTAGNPVSSSDPA